MDRMPLLLADPGHGAALLLQCRTSPLALVLPGLYCAPISLLETCVLSLRLV